jgi:hypothetical protein
MISQEDLRMLIAIMFRGSGKSTIMTTIYPLYALFGKPQKKLILIVSQTADLARTHLKNIKSELESNPLLKEDLGPFKDVDNTWNAQAIELPQQNAMIVAISIDQSIRGIRYKQYRPDLIITDDIEDSQSVKTEESRKRTHDLYSSEIAPLGDLGTQIVMVGNYLHPSGLLSKLRTDVNLGKINGKALFVPLLDGEGKVAWPAKFPTIDRVNELSGRTIKKWLDSIRFTTKIGKKLSLSRIYATLNNPFYYGEFQYGDDWFKGSHEPLITKDLFDKVQKQLIVPPKNWHKKQFPFKTLCRCGSCGGGVTAEEKYKKLKYGGYAKHVYYHCARSVDYDCNDPYITEADLISQLLSHLNNGNIQINKSKIAKKLTADIERFHKLREQVLHQEYLSGNLGELENLAVKPNDEEMGKDYLRHILKTGTAEERQEALQMIKTKFSLSNKQLLIN